MDNTASLRRIKTAVEQFQKGEAYIAKKDYNAAESAILKGLKVVPQDYAGLVIMAKCKMAQGQHDQALLFSEKARRVYPQEAQANYISGFSSLQLNRLNAAVANFSAYDKKLPGNPNTVFFRGYAYEKMGRKQQAATDYTAYLNQVNAGDQARHAYDKLVKWGVYKTGQPGPVTASGRTVSGSDWV